jgi:DNA-binding transcriptional LysR family regulator
MRWLNLDQLHTLVTVSELGSFSKAALALHLSQPTVSLHVRELETRHDVRLLQRDARSVQLTPAGRLLVERARPLLRDAAHAAAALKAHAQGRGGRVRLGTQTNVLAYLMPPVLARLAERFPEIDVELAILGSAQMLERLRDGTLEVGVVSVPTAGTRGLEIGAWRRDPMMAFVPLAWPAPSAATPQWLASRPLILNEPVSHMQQITAAWFAAAGEAPAPRIVLNYTEAMKSLVAAGYGAALLPLESPADEITRGRLQLLPLEPPLERGLGVAARPAAQRDAATDAVLSVLAEFRAA